MEPIPRLREQIESHKRNGDNLYLEKEGNLCGFMSCVDFEEITGVNHVCKGCIGTIRIKPLRNINPDLNWNNLELTIQKKILLNL